MSRRQAVLAGSLAVVVLAAAIALLVLRGRDHGAPHRLLTGDTTPSTTSSSSTTTSTTTPVATTTTPVRSTARTPATATPSAYTGRRGGIAYVDGAASPGHAGISVMDADGTHSRHIADFDQARTASRPDSPWFGGEGFAGLAWNGSGDLIAAGRDGKYGGGLEVMRPDGTGRRTLVFDSGVEHPSFSPDGKWLVFDNPGAHLATSGPGRLMIIGVDGRDEHPLGGDAAPGDPAWSPDGGSIVVAGAQLSIVRPDGSSVRRIPIPAGTYASGPAWSPDGTWISFTATTTGSSPTYTSDIYEVHPDGTALSRLTDNHDLSMSASWSPDGSRLVFSRSQLADNTSTPAQIWIMTAAGTDARQVTRSSDGAAQPAWG